ncbi:NAD(P)/FAD-dependent oxidoreductase [Pseudogulbenkiania ferrooxidans]|uniref:Amino acid dehydrogenase n=1 Tax=Pseudogulbenkiania ferrooxidans EGD-HP2 TaxID=1388764 RepID=A0ABN0NAD8_9NEIS|nr:FAD-dependent oxidoreductase [Pseudogulbenkiania ferrooxidans]ERE17763.1 amino acid dehydrogenase [Pseudogulbenkiania ferrooxidans EGD-HP2]
MTPPLVPGSAVIVVGAGVVGIATALQLRLAGFEVTLLDRGEPAMETSYGNAGAFAISDVIPLAEPGVLRKVPGWMLDPLGPLALRWRYLPTLAPWLLRFLAASRPRRVAELTQALAALLGRVNDDYAALIPRAGLGHLWRRHGNLTLYRNREELDAAAPAWDDKRRHGVRWLALSRDALVEGEPTLREEWQYAVQVPDWSHVDDPYVFSRGLFDAFIREGGRFVRDEALGTLTEAGRVVGVETAGGRLRADAVVIACGVWSDRFVKQHQYRVPLESERGYHVNLPKAGVALRHFIQCASESFVILPMVNGGLRLAGTVELAHRDAPPDWRRAHILLDKARRIVGDFSTEDMTVWMGNRPSLPDTLPIIGPAPLPGLWFATGHGHLGLTLAATTGALLRDMLQGRPPALDMQPYRLSRF